MMPDSNDAANVIAEAGGDIVGKTRLQKLVYFLEVAGIGYGFKFEYRRFGPYSEELSLAVHNAEALEFITKAERETTWGGTVTKFSTSRKPADSSAKGRKELAKMAAKSDSIEIELAATALFLHLQKEQDPWGETAARKPEKAGNGRIDKAKELYKRLRSVNTARPLPAF